MNKEELVKEISKITIHVDSEINEEIATFILERERKIVQALNSLIDDEPCSFDHHGYCQTHFTSSKPCVMEEARKTLKNAGVE